MEECITQVRDNHKVGRCGAFSRLVAADTFARSRSMAFMREP